MTVQIAKPELSPLVSELKSVAKRTKLFDDVNSSILSEAPTGGKICTVWLGRARTSRSFSGLPVTSLEQPIAMRSWINANFDSLADKDSAVTTVQALSYELLGALHKDLNLRMPNVEIDLFGFERGEGALIDPSTIQIDGKTGIYAASDLLFSVIFKNAYMQEHG